MPRARITGSAACGELCKHLYDEADNRTDNRELQSVVPGRPERRADWEHRVLVVVPPDKNDTFIPPRRQTVQFVGLDLYTEPNNRGNARVAHPEHLSTYGQAVPDDVT